MVIVINSVIVGFSWVDLVRLAASTVRLQASVLEDFSNILCSVDTSVFPFLKTQYNVLAQGLTLLSQGNCWSLAYKGDSYPAVNIWPTPLFLS